MAASSQGYDQISQQSQDGYQTGAAPHTHTAGSAPGSSNVFASCFPGSSGLSANLILMVALCAAQLSGSMGIGSLLLLGDFFRRLSCAFLLIAQQKADQVEESFSGSSAEKRDVLDNGNLLSKVLVAVYLTSASFFMACLALWRM